MPSKKKPARSKARSTPDTAAKAPPEALPTAPADQAAVFEGVGFPVVGVGASAGGLAAFEAFFSAMPTDSDTGMAFVLVQHLSPDHKSILADLIKRYTRMDVFEVEDGMKVMPNRAYIIPPNRDMAFLNGTLRLLEPSAPRGQRLPIDFFFRSLAQDQHERAICIVLSGTGSDGTLGVRAVKGEGGMVMAQAPDTTQYDGMPRSAIATGLVDFVVPPAEMPAQLVAYASHAFGRKRPAASAPVQAGGDVLKKICVVLRAQVGHDFSQYKEHTLMRRIERRMALHQIAQAEDYLQILQKTPAEVDSLFRDLLIGVTAFFRDPEAFAALRSQVVPRLFNDKRPGEAVRVWVAGCSTGEEAYSIAILLQEHLQTLRQTYKVQVFATDIDRRAIEQARRGVFPASISADVSPERLSRFFFHDPDAGTYRALKVIRDLLVFSEQDVIKDPPFSKLDLISCRNLLIYMDATLQKKLIPLFHYALNPGGALFLGTSETVGELGSLFAPVDRKGKVYVRKPDLPGATRPAFGQLVAGPVEDPAAHRPAHGLSRGGAKLDLKQVTETALLQHYAQAAVLVSSRGEILYIHGRTGKYLEPAPGNADVNIVPMARDGLKRELATALRRAVATKEPVRHPGLLVKTNGEYTAVNLVVLPLSPPGSMADMYLVVLDEAATPALDGTPASDSHEPGTPESALADRVVSLEQELQAKDEYLQTTLEEMETSNEELKSTNEEMQSVNEELQSTNEELETSKEELQSVNEELATVNAELQTKVVDLSRANNDMNNLLAGTGVGTLFVDHRLRISRFTPATTRVINLIESDVGRPVAHIASNLQGNDRLLDDIRGVLDTLAPFEAEVQTRAGEWYLMGIRPYRTLDNVIEGAVITFVEISERRKVQEALRESEERLRLALEVGGIGTWWTDCDAGRTHFSAEMAVMLGLPSAGEMPWEDSLMLFHPDDRQRVRDAFDAACAPSSAGRISLEARIVRPDGQIRWLSLTAKLTFRDAPEGRTPLRQTVVCVDVTERKRS